MNIRRETAADFTRIYELVKTAFQTAKVSDGKEQDFVEQLRSGGNYIPELALVAEEGGRMAGHIMLTKANVVNDNGKVATLLLAPIAVGLEYRNRGIGAGMIKESFRLAREMGYKSVFLVGDPAYYCRFGFRPSIEFGVAQRYNIPDEFVLACELVPDALSGACGVIDWS